jgi:hypothetical protein
MESMKKVSIGKRRSVADIRELWSKETEFSDWLVTQPGIDLLADDLEITIENPHREARGANFPCDVVANLMGDDKHVVVIENQFGRTDHDHLAKLLTYAAAHKAMTGIWIAEEAADDHRQVIDWLNENTPETISLYLVELKAYTIGSSPAAPQLDVVCKPNRLVKPINADMSPGEKQRRDWREKFWKDIHARVQAAKPPFRLQRPGQDHWSSISVGRSGFHIDMLLTPKNESIVVQVTVQPKGWKQDAFKQLMRQEAAIEKEIGRKLDWRPMADQVSSRIVLEEEINPDDKENHDKVCDWFAAWTPKMYRAFQERIKNLKAPSGMAKR